jgi:hypothetical protein
MEKKAMSKTFQWLRNFFEKQQVLRNTRQYAQAQRWVGGGATHHTRQGRYT